jgi:hypothetical protein
MPDPRPSKQSLPTISNYGRYSSDNYGAHALRIDVGPITVWFSYRTPVAFHVDGHPRIIHSNDWAQTTGKHLNWIDGGTPEARKARVNHEAFARLWSEQVAPLLDPASVLASVG